MKPVRAINVNAPDKAFLDEFHKILAKSIVRRFGEEEVINNLMETLLNNHIDSPIISK